MFTNLWCAQSAFLLYDFPMYLPSETLKQLQLEHTEEILRIVPTYLGSTKGWRTCLLSFMKFILIIRKSMVIIMGYLFMPFVASDDIHDFFVHFFFTKYPSFLPPLGHTPYAHFPWVSFYLFQWNLSFLSNVIFSSVYQFMPNIFITLSCLYKPIK